MKRLILAGAAMAVLAVAGSTELAGARPAGSTFQVMAGEQIPCGFAPCKGLSGIPKGSTLDRFIPSKLTIAAGDSVTFSSATFHTVSFGPKPQPLFTPDPKKGKYAPLDDAAGSPFYFGGMPKLIYNPLAFAPFGPHTITGKTPTSSGALSPAGPRAKPATFTYSFPKAGTYKLFCNIHPGMTATITVKAAGSAVPKTPAQVSAAALSEVNADWAQAKSDAAAAKPPANTVYAGVGTGTTVFGFFPQTLHVKAGTTVTFTNKSPNEVHNATFGPKKFILGLQKKTDLQPTGPAAPNQVSPFLIYGSEPKGKYTYDGTNHGNGYFSTPLLADSPAIPLPTSWKVTFSKAGTYKYFCWIHGPDMGGTVVVTP